MAKKTILTRGLKNELNQIFGYLLKYHNTKKQFEEAFPEFTKFIKEIND
jgi:hypothetical protein